MDVPSNAMPRILVLHGYTQSAKIIREKLVKFLPTLANYIVPDAPLKLDQTKGVGEEGEENDDGNKKFGWFPLSKEQLHENGVVVTEDDVTILKDYATIHAWHGHYDAVIAYSQGCLVAQILLERQIITSAKLLYFCPIPLPVQPLLSLPCTILTRIYLGGGDIWVPETNTSFIDYHTKSRQAFANDNHLLEIKRHAKGHTIPVNKPYRTEYGSFLFECEQHPSATYIMK